MDQKFDRDWTFVYCGGELVSTNPGSPSGGRLNSTDPAIRNKLDQKRPFYRFDSIMWINAVHYMEQLGDTR